MLEKKFPFILCATIIFLGCCLGFTQAKNYQLSYVNENNFQETRQKYQQVFVLFYDSRNEISIKYKQLLESSHEIQTLVPVLIYIMAPSLNTAEDLGITLHPYFKLYIDGIEAEDHLTHFRDIQSQQNITNWIKTTLSKNYHDEHHISTLIEVSNYERLQEIIQNNGNHALVILCSSNQSKRFKILHQRMKDEDIRLIQMTQKQNFEQLNCKENQIVVKTQTLHNQKTNFVLDFTKLNNEQIVTSILDSIHPDIFFSDDHLFLHHASHILNQRKIGILFVEDLKQVYSNDYLLQQLHQNIDSFAQNSTKKIQFFIADLTTQGGQGLMKLLKLKSLSLPSLLYVHHVHSHAPVRNLIEFEEFDAKLIVTQLSNLFEKKQESQQSSKRILTRGENDDNIIEGFFNQHQEISQINSKNFERFYQNQTNDFKILLVFNDGRICNKCIEALHFFDSVIHSLDQLESLTVNLAVGDLAQDHDLIYSLQDKEIYVTHNRKMGIYFIDQMGNSLIDVSEYWLYEDLQTIFIQLQRISDQSLQMFHKVKFHEIDPRTQLNQQESLKYGFDLRDIAFGNIDEKTFQNRHIYEDL